MIKQQCFKLFVNVEPSLGRCLPGWVPLATWHVHWLSRTGERISANVMKQDPDPRSSTRRLLLLFVPDYLVFC